MRVVILGAGGFAVASALSVFAPSYETYAATLVLTGFCVVTTLTTANGYVQTTTDPALRGRVLALYMAILLGGTPVGAPIVGAVAAEFGPRAAIALAAGVALVACGIGVTWTLASGRVHRHDTKRFRLTVDETRPIAVVNPSPRTSATRSPGPRPSRSRRANDRPSARATAPDPPSRALPCPRSPKGSCPPRSAAPDGADRDRGSTDPRGTPAGEARTDRRKPFPSII